MKHSQATALFFFFGIFTLHCNNLWPPIELEPKKEITHNIENFEVIVTVNAQAADYNRTLDRLKVLLAETSQVAPKIHSSLASKVKIWLTNKKWQNSAATYHPSVEWLSQNGHDTRMASGIEIINLDNFTAWAVKGDQPMMVLHELTHAFHDQMLNFGNPDIKTSFEKAKISGKYNSVRYKSMTGPLLWAYALTNEREYFAEASEAYFGTNDYYPFNRSELLSFDPEIYALVERYLVP